MKTSAQSRFLFRNPTTLMKTSQIAWLIAVMVQSLAAQAQPIQPEVLVSFDGTNGAFPQAALTHGSDGNLYGTTSRGGETLGAFGEGFGTVFKVTTNGTLTTL